MEEILFLEGITPQMLFFSVDTCVSGTLGDTLFLQVLTSPCLEIKTALGSPTCDLGG